MKITPRKGDSNTITVKTDKTQGSKQIGPQVKWWKSSSKKELAGQVLTTIGFLKEQQQSRYRQAAVYARLYGNRSVFNVAGSSFTRMSNASNSLPQDRPTFNLVQSCIDTKVARITQSRPRPVFLTDNGDYRDRMLAKQMNSFINGELYKVKAHRLGELMLRDAETWGTGCLKVYANSDHKVTVERVLLTDLLVDPNDAFYGQPTQLFHLKLVDRSVLKEAFPDNSSDIDKAEQGFISEQDAQKTISDQVIVGEAWHLPSGSDSTDGRHSIVCSSGVIFDEPWTKSTFPFVFLDSSPPLTGFWGQGACERLMGTQLEINKLLWTISQSINLVGVPRVFVEDGSKVVKAAINNMIGAIVTYRGTRPSYEVAPCVPQELYAQLERLIRFGFNQEGVSAMAAQAQKPAGLNSGEAIRNYDDLQSDRFAALSKRYDNVFIDLAYQIIDCAKDIVDETGSYSTVFPNKNGVKEITFPDLKRLEDPFVIECYDASSLPRDPAGRLQKVTELMQSGIVSLQEGRRLLDYPDIEQIDKLASAAEERILKVLDEIVEDGKFTPPDPFMVMGAEPGLAVKLTVEYYNLYVAAKLSEDRAQMLRDFFSQIQMIEQASQPPPPPQPPMGPPQAMPQGRPVSDMLPNAPH